MSDKVPQRAAILVRISDARDDDTAGVDRQEADSRALAASLGWTVTHMAEENDTSAFKRRLVCQGCLKPARANGDGQVCTCKDEHDKVPRTYRPEYRRLLQMLKSREVDALIAYDLDRAFRDPLDLEDLINVVESRRLYGRIKSVTGSLRLDSPSDITNLRFMVTVANDSSRSTARRVARAMKDKAAAGEFTGGLRPFGFERDGLTLREAEATEIRRWCDRLLAGESLFAIVSDLRGRGVPTVLGKAWTSLGVRDVLVSPRVAGYAVHQVREKSRELKEAGLPVPVNVGVVGKGKWPAILDEDKWFAVATLLTDPARRTSPASSAPRWLGSLIYRCGPCADAGVDEWVSIGNVTNGRGPAYMCRSRKGHLRRSQPQVDEFVEEVVIRRLSQPDAVDLLAPKVPGVDRAGLSAELNALRERANQLAASFADGEITAAQMSAGSVRLNERIKVIERELAAAVTRTPLDLVAGVGTPDVREAWGALSLASKRAILRLLVDVRLDRGVPGRKPLSDEYKAHRAGCETCREAGARRAWQEGCPEGARLHHASYFDPETVRIDWAQ